MFKVAPRYLSGVSVFLGDDITTRASEGELAVFIGQATKGPRVPVQLNTVDGATATYGNDNPLVKALYEFYDGYSDAGQRTALKFVTLRVGGKPASLTTSYGLDIETVDAYDGIENDYFIFASNQPDAYGVKIWDKNKRLVYSSYNGLDAGYFNVTAVPTGDGTVTSVYGVDLDADPLATPVSMADIVREDITNPSGSQLSVLASIAATGQVLSVGSAIDTFPLTGTLKVTEVTGAITIATYVNYTNTASNVTARTFALDAAIGVAFSTNAKVSLVGSDLVAGDSELNLTDRELYEKMRNGLLDIEMYTPDYIVPGGVAYNAVDTYDKVTTKLTMLKQNIVDGNTTITVDAAAEWPETGTVDIYDGTNHTFMAYTEKADGEDYVLTVSEPTFTITNIGPATGADAYKTVTVSENVGTLITTGFLKIGSNRYFYSSFDTGTKKITLSSQVASGDRGAGTCKKVLPVITIASTPTTVSCTYSKTTKRELGIGYVKETDSGDGFTFNWSNTKQSGYYLAHFGYMFANFCNEAAIGYNTPLCGMNVDIKELEAANFSRAAIKTWVGTLPTYKYNLTQPDKIDEVTGNGTGLLGEATLNGSVSFNRSYMNSAADPKPSDPAYGLLMTDEGFVDGIEVIDTYNKPVDLGKFILVGAGLLSFGNKASNTGYVDSCGIYSLGQLAGKPKNEGLSFSKIGTASNTDVSVIVTRALYSDLAAAGYIVVTREKGLGWVVNNANSCARNNSGYFLISTTRTIKYVIEGKRSILVNFIGKPVSRLLYESARTALADSFTKDVASGLLAANAIWNLQIVQAAQAIGKFQLTCKINPALELTQVDIDAVIDRGTVA